MNRYIKFPIISSCDPQGLHTVSILSGLSGSTVNLDYDKAVNDIRKYIQYQFRDSNAYLAEPEFYETEIRFHNVSVRPSYATSRRSFPASYRIELKVPYVLGRRRDDSFICVLPTIQDAFFVLNDKGIQGLVEDRVKSALREQTPEMLSHYLCPPNLKLDQVNVKLKSRHREQTHFALPVTETVATPLGKRTTQKQFPFAWQRQSEVAHLIARLEEPRGNILLLGEPGVGKTTILVNALRELERQRIARNKKAKEEDDDDGTDNIPTEVRFWSTNAARLISGMKYLGQWEERVEEVIHELGAVGGTLCIEELEPLVRLGGKDATDSVASFLAAFLENNELRMIVEATRDQLDSCRRLLPGFDRYFQVINISKFELAEARSVLNSIAEQFRKNDKIGHDIESAELAYRLFQRFLPYDAFPGKCVKFWREIFEGISIEMRKGRLKGLPVDSVPTRVDQDTVIARFVKQTGLPEILIRDEVPLSAKDVNDFFTARIIGQDHACHVVAQVVTTLKAGLNDPNRPIGVQLFSGPTGVGKTEMAKTLSEFMFGSGDSSNRMIRLDMSEYSGFGAAHRLLVQPDGSPSKLIQDVRKQPFSVILLDEIEKAAAEVFDVLMGMFDEGRLTDRWGRTTDFRSTIIVMTSNLGVRKSDPIGFDASAQVAFEKAIRDFFRPEFFNRFDAVVRFKALDKDSIQKITELELNKLKHREGVKKRNLAISWTPEMILSLAKSGYDPKLGARPLQRSIETRVVSEIARLLAEKPETEGAELLLSVSSSDQVQLNVG